MDKFDYLKLFHDISLEDYSLLNKHMRSKSFTKREYIIVPGQIHKELLFITDGVQMSYFESEKKIHVAAFTYAPGLCALPDSFPFQKPSEHYLICLTDTKVDYITFTDLNILFDKSHQIERLFRKLTEHILAGLLKRHLDLNTMTIEERYKAFCQRSPHLLQFVPHKYIASYLGMDPTNFSKLYNTIRF